MVSDERDNQVCTSRPGSRGGNKMSVAATFGLNSRYLVVDSDICGESYYSVMDHLGLCRTISGNCLKFVLEATIDCSELI